jgi:hypothetical protein
MIEYGPVQAGSKIFICPLKSVSIAGQRKIVIVQEWGEAFKVYAPFETDYHVFASTSRTSRTSSKPRKSNKPTRVKSGQDFRACSILNTINSPLGTTRCATEYRKAATIRYNRPRLLRWQRKQHHPHGRHRGILIN